MNAIPKIVLQNPFRILGVYANSRRQEIIANRSRATAFLNVNRPVEYPLDLKGILPPLSRTLDMLNEAEAHLSIAKEQIKYAQFWFLKMTPLDDVAFNHLVAGNMAGAMEIWSHQDSLSSLQNKMVCHLISENHRAAITTAEKLYENFGDDYIQKVDASCTLNVKGNDLFHHFLDILDEEFGTVKLLGYIQNSETKAYLKNKAIGPLVNKISSEVERAKSVNHNDANARLEAARNLIANTKDVLNQLRNILPASNPQYQMTADKLGLEILQCGIDYFNNSEDEDAPRKAMKVQKYAQTVVVGTLAKQRCEENVNILQGIIDKLPPEEVSREHANLQRIISSFLLLSANVDDVVNFLKDTRDDLVSIKEKLGKNNAYYIKQATDVARIALNKSIDAFNEAHEILLPKLKLSGAIRDGAIKKMKHVFAVSWEVILWLELIDTDNDFRNTSLIRNKLTLKETLEQVGAFNEPINFFGGSVFEGCVRNVTVDDYTYFTELELFATCNNITCCNKYIARFPHGKHINIVRLRLVQFKDDEKFKEAEYLEDFIAYLKAYPRGRHAKEAKEKIAQIKSDLSRQIEACSDFSACLALFKKCKEFKSDGLYCRYDDKLFSLCKKQDDYQSYLDTLGNEALHAQEAEKIIRKKIITNEAFRAFIVHSIFILLSYCIYYFNDNVLMEAKWDFIIGGFGLGSLSWLLLFRQRKYINKKTLVFVVICVVLLISICTGLLVKRNSNRQLVYQEQMTDSYNSFMSSPKISTGLTFLSDYPDCDSARQDSVKNAVCAVLKEEVDSLLENTNNDIDQVKEYLSMYSAHQWLVNNEDIKRTIEKVEELEREQRLKRQKEADKKRKQEEYELYGTDANAWKTANARNTINAYKDYLSRYPHGKYVKAANKKIIDLEVQEVASSGDYGYLPPSQKMSYGTSRTSSVHIKNSSGSTITILYSGTKSMRIVLGPLQSQTISLPSSSYKVVATAPGVRPFYGTENLTGGNYESEYYITTSRY